MNRTVADDPSTTIDNDLITAVQMLAPGAADPTLVAGRADLVRVEGPDGVWVIRRWPANTPIERIEFVHQVWERARRAGISIVPELPAQARSILPPIVRVASRHYDVRRWIPGRPVVSPSEDRTIVDRPLHLPLVLPDSVVLPVIETIARLHLETSELTRFPSAPVAPLYGMIAAVRGVWSEHRSRLRPVAPSTPAVQRWLAIGERALPAAEAAILAASLPPADHAVVLHLGVWPAHILVDTTAQALTGLLGWETTAVGSPVLDLAQLIVRCRGWSAANAETTIAAYGSVRPLTPEERRVLPAVAALDLVASAGQMLDHAYGTRPPNVPPPSSALRAATAALINSLEVVETVLTTPERQSRVWRRRAHPATERPTRSKDQQRIRP
jgi:hypothetical protein